MDDDMITALRLVSSAGTRGRSDRSISPTPSRPDADSPPDYGIRNRDDTIHTPLTEIDSELSIHDFKSPSSLSMSIEMFGGLQDIGSLSLKPPDPQKRCIPEGTPSSYFPPLSPKMQVKSTPLRPSDRGRRGKLPVKMMVQS